MPNYVGLSLKFLTYTFLQIISNLFAPTPIALCSDLVMLQVKRRLTRYLAPTITNDAVLDMISVPVVATSQRRTVVYQPQAK